jgi:hypothetical protein
LCKIIGTAMNMHHATKSNITTSEMTVVKNDMMSVMIIVEMTTEVIMVMIIKAMDTINIKGL